MKPFKAEESARDHGKTPRSAPNLARFKTELTTDHHYPRLVLTGRNTYLLLRLLSARDIHLVSREQRGITFNDMAPSAEMEEKRGKGEEADTEPVLGRAGSVWKSRSGKLYTYVVFFSPMRWSSYADIATSITPVSKHDSIAVLSGMVRAMLKICPENAEEIKAAMPEALQRKVPVVLANLEADWREHGTADAANGLSSKEVVLLRMQISALNDDIEMLESLLKCRTSQHGEAYSKSQEKERQYDAAKEERDKLQEKLNKWYQSTLKPVDL